MFWSTHREGVKKRKGMFDFESPDFERGLVSVFCALHFPRLRLKSVYSVK